MDLQRLQKALDMALKESQTLEINIQICGFVSVNVYLDVRLEVRINGWKPQYTPI